MFTVHLRCFMTFEDVARCPLHFASLAKASIASAPEEAEEEEEEEEGGGEEEPVRAMLKRGPSSITRSR